MKTARLCWVQQEDEYGCGLAALAMLLGESYQQAKSRFATYDLSSRGLHIDDFLAEFGFAQARIYSRHPIKNESGEFPERTPWPPEPFADVHLCKVRVSKSSPCDHWVIMLADGSVLDPLTPESKRLPDYHEVHNVAAIVRFAACEATDTVGSEPPRKG